MAVEVRIQGRDWVAKLDVDTLVKEGDLHIPLPEIDGAETIFDWQDLHVMYVPHREVVVFHSMAYNRQEIPFSTWDLHEGRVLEIWLTLDVNVFGDPNTLSKLNWLERAIANLIEYVANKIMLIKCLVKGHDWMQPNPANPRWRLCCNCLKLQRQNMDDPEKWESLDRIV